MYNKRYKRLSELTIAELAGNRCIEEILDLEVLLRQSIRLFLSRLLAHTDADNPYSCNIRYNGLHNVNKSIDQTVITHVWQDPVEGVIVFALNDSDKVIDLADIILEDQIYILESLTSYHER